MEHLSKVGAFIKSGSSLAVQGLQLGINHQLRAEWMENHFTEGKEMGLLAGEYEALVRAQAKLPSSEAHLRDVALLSAGLTAVTLPPAVILAGAGEVFQSPTSTAAAGLMFGVIPRAIKMGYLGARMIQDRFNGEIDKQHLPSLRREALVLLTSNAPMVGFLAVLPRMAAEAPELATFFKDYYKQKLAVGKMERPVSFLVDNLFHLPHKRVTVHETPQMPFGSNLYRNAVRLSA